MYKIAVYINTDALTETAINYLVATCAATRARAPRYSRCSDKSHSRREGQDGMQLNSAAENKRAPHTFPHVPGAVFPFFSARGPFRPRHTGNAEIRNYAAGSGAVLIALPSRRGNRRRARSSASTLNASLKIHGVFPCRGCNHGARTCKSASSPAIPSDISPPSPPPLPPPRDRRRGHVVTWGNDDLRA